MCLLNVWFCLFLVCLLVVLSISCLSISCLVYFLSRYFYKLTDTVYFLSVYQLSCLLIGLSLECLSIDCLSFYCPVYLLSCLLIVLSIDCLSIEWLSYDCLSIEWLSTLCQCAGLSPWQWTRAPWCPPNIWSSPSNHSSPQALIIRRGPDLHKRENSDVSINKLIKTQFCEISKCKIFTALQWSSSIKSDKKSKMKLFLTCIKERDQYYCTK